jgi:hypothetical protein
MGGAARPVRLAPGRGRSPVTARCVGVLLAVVAFGAACGAEERDEVVARVDASADASRSSELVEARPADREDADQGADLGVLDPAAPDDDGDDGGQLREGVVGAADDGGALETDEAEQPAAPSRRNLITWILGLGPSAPTGPSAFRAYGLLVDGDCQGVLDRFDEGHPEQLRLGAASEELYRAAASACLAAFDGRLDLWTVAEAGAASSAVGDGGCLDRAVGEMLASLVAAHRDDPAAGFERAGGAGATPPCPTITQLSPPRGPPGTVVRISGDHLHAPQLEVHLVVGEQGPIVELVPQRDGSDLLVTIDGVGGPASVCLALHTVPDWYAAGATFELEAPTAAETVEGADVDDTDEASGAPAVGQPPSPVTCPPAP